MTIFQKIKVTLQQMFLGIWFSPLRQKIILPALRRSTARAKNNNMPSKWQVRFHRFMVWALRNPGYMLRGYKKTLRVCPTYKCNAGCSTCYARECEDAYSEMMNLAGFKKTLGWAKQNHMNRIRFLGGEPTTHPEFPAMLKACYKEHMSVTLATNNCYSEEVLHALKSLHVKDMTINYNASLQIDENSRKIFDSNLQELYENKKSFGFSYFLNGKDSKAMDKSFTDTLEKYNSQYVRISLELPAQEDHSSFNFDFCSDLLFERMITLIRLCARNYIPCFIVRALPLCLFSEEQKKEIESFGKYMFYSRCIISYTQGVDTEVTVNPDLSIFPCVTVFKKGKTLLEYENLKEIREHYNLLLREDMKKLRIEACRECKYYKNFLASLAEERTAEKNKFDDRMICQGGCLYCKKIIL